MMQEGCADGLVFLCPLQQAVSLHPMGGLITQASPVSTAIIPWL